MAGGVLVIVILALTLALSNETVFALLLFWPIIIFRPLFPPTETAPLFPGIPNGVGVLVSLIFATLVYSLVIYVALWCRGIRRPLR